MKTLIYFSIILVFLSLIIVLAQTTISDLRVDSPIGLFQSLNMPSRTSFIDSDNNRIIAIFNGNDSANLITAQQQSLLSSGQTSFFGDIDNFDNIDGPSRFKETNLNDGTRATASFVTNNNLGFSTSFGITSSGFQLNDTPLENYGFIFHDSPAPFASINNLFYGWTWKVNEDNSTTSFDYETVMDLTPEGNLDISQNYSGSTIVLDITEFRPGCNIEIEGTIVYEANGTKGDFFGCKRQNINTFVWSKFS